MWVSRRVLQEDEAVSGLPVHSMKECVPTAEDGVVQVEPWLTPIGMRFSAGEKLLIRISGVVKTVLSPVDQATLEVEGVEDINESVTLV